MKNTNIKNSIVILICIVIHLFPTICFALETTVGTSSEDLYNEMYAYFVIGERTNKFDTAMAIYEENPQLKTYSDAEKIYRYMVARNCLSGEEMSDALILFQSLDDFRDSRSYASYVNGRIAENESRYEDAVNCYMQASDLVLTDCIERMRNCNTLTGEERKGNQYKEAINKYESAMLTENQAEIAEVYKLFTALGEYQESGSYAAKCSDWLRAKARKISISAKAEQNVISVSWTDTEKDHFYNILYRPENGYEYLTKIRCQSPVQLENLLPNTTYEIVITDEDNSQVSSSLTKTVLSADQYPSGKLKYVRMEVAGIQNDGSILDLVTPEQVFNDYPVFLYQSEDNAFLASKLSSYTLYGSMVYKNMTSEEMNVEIGLILRSTQSGAFYSEEGNIILPADSRAQIRCFNIGKILDNVKPDLIVDQYSIEVYIDNMLFCREVFTVK
nr:hypothetical protein [Clostridia bacterium]